MKLETVKYSYHDVSKKNSEAMKALKKSINISNIIYLFFNDDECLYIGETDTSLKDRCYKHTPKESESEWFKESNLIHIIKLDDSKNSIDKIARGALESSFILAYRPKYNKKA